MRIAAERRLAQLAATAKEQGTATTVTAATQVGVTTEQPGSSGKQDIVASRTASAAGDHGGGTARNNEAGILSPAGDFSSRLKDQARGLNLLKGSPPSMLMPETGRRKLYVGASERNVQVRMYAESIAQKWERNGNLNYSDSARNKSRGDAVVSVVVRKDGSIEEIIIHRSSGSTELDRAIRNIASLNARYAVFPESVANEYDVIEIRKVWRFEERLMIAEEWR